MKKQIAKLSLKTDQIINLSKAQAQHVVAGMRSQTVTGCNTKGFCPTDI